MKIFVVGSINMDLVINSSVEPKSGETIKGNSFFMNPGGKGANQAFAASLMGANTYMIGTVGIPFGDELINNLKNNNVNTKFVNFNNSLSSGVAVISVVNGENKIIIDEGANNSLSIENIKNALKESRPKDLIVLQNEIPIEIIEATILIAHKLNLTILYNPAPSVEVDFDLFQYIDFFIPNQHETKFYTGIYPKNHLDAQRAANKLFDLGLKKVLITMGLYGSILYEKDKNYIFMPSVKTNIIDTTAAGDTYIGVFAAMLSKGKDVNAAMNYATYAAALSISKKGAQQSIPTIKEVERFIENAKK